MGLRPNKRRTEPPSLGCRCAATPVPVVVHDRLDGRPEVVAHLCPLCYEKVFVPPVMALDAPPPLQFDAPDFDIINKKEWR